MDGDMIVADGMQLLNREEISTSFQHIFNRFHASDATSHEIHDLSIPGEQAVLCLDDKSPGDHWSRGKVSHTHDIAGFL